MSIQRAYAQRTTNNNVTQIIPVFSEILPSNGAPFADLSGVALYNLNLTNAQYIGGIYYVDLSGNDSNGLPLNATGVLKPFTVDPDEIPLPMITFTIQAPAAASVYPGMEFTIFFKNLPQLDGPPIFSIGIVKSNGEPVPYIVSPPAPVATGPNINSSVTLKSDGTSWNISSSGPAGWMGLPLLTVLLSIINDYNNIP
jgi:hypothetical protein